MLPASNLIQNNEKQGVTRLFECLILRLYLGEELWDVSVETKHLICNKMASSQSFSVFSDSCKKHPFFPQSVCVSF